MQLSPSYDFLAPLGHNRIYPYKRPALINTFASFPKIMIYINLHEFLSAFLGEVTLKNEVYLQRKNLLLEEQILSF